MTDQTETNKPFIRTPYNYDKERVSFETGFASSEPSLAVQSQKEEADINTIVRRFGLTGELPSNIRTPQYGDFTGITDYQTALNQVIAAQTEFMKLPASLRERFGNSPQNLLEFITDPQNKAEAQELGLLPKEPKIEPTASAGVPPSAGAGQASQPATGATPMAKLDKTGA